VPLRMPRSEKSVNNVKMNMNLGKKSIAPPHMPRSKKTVNNLMPSINFGHMSNAPLIMPRSKKSMSNAMRSVNLGKRISTTSGMIILRLSSHCCQNRENSKIHG
jgi:hypothetical protein